MQTGFSALDIVFLIILVIFIVSRFMGNKLPKDNKEDKGKVVNFPKGLEPINKKPAEKPIKKEVKKDLSHLKGIDLIKASDSYFNENEFLSGAEMAYKMYYDAINEQDEETLENMMAPRKFDEIMESIETLETEDKKRVVLIDKFKNIEILDAKLHGRTAVIDVKYEVLQTDVIEKMDKQLDKVVQKPKNIQTVWTWARSVDSEDLNWELETMSLLS